MDFNFWPARGSQRATVERRPVIRGDQLQFGRVMLVVLSSTRPMPRLATRVSLAVAAATAVAAMVGGLPARCPAGTFFEQQVAPLLANRCLSCHNDQDREGELSLQTSADLVRRQWVVAGDPAASRLLEVVEPTPAGEVEMPIDGEPLAAKERAALRKWIAAGAQWPDGLRLEMPAVTDASWWSLRAPSRSELPPVDPRDAAWARNPIDAFILRKLREEGLAPSPEADRRTLVRRLYYDLVGLPPPVPEIDRFLSDRSELAYERLVDRLLASPHYGERYARHWLDVVHYGDSHGYDKDKLRPNAWPYRDYVIRAFNDDLPYSEFVEQQLAADVLYAGDTDAFAALGFVAAGPWDFIGHVEVSGEKIDGRVARNLDRDDMVVNTIQTFCSVTVGCARCHHHKFDPITQDDYYSLQAVFAGVGRNDVAYGDGQTVYAIATDFEPQANHRPHRGSMTTIHVLRRGAVEAAGDVVGPGALRLPDGPPGRFELPEGHTEGARREALARWIVDRGNPLTWRSIVNRMWQYHFGRGLCSTPNDLGRMGALPTHPELLDWLAIEFRDGGQSIARPQSLKQLHRLIVTSAAYRQTSSYEGPQAAVDQSNRFVWRQQRRRLEAEAIRDSVLVAAGKLDRRMYGPGFQDFVLEQTAHSPQFVYEKYDPDDATTWRRSVYRFLPRSQPQPFMETLDCADPSQQVAVRDVTVTPLSALALLNNRFMLRMAEHFADRLEHNVESIDEQVEAAFTWAMSRPPEADELESLAEHARQFGLASMCRVVLNLDEFVFVD